MQGLKTSSKMSTSVNTLPFDGKREKWREWNLKVLAFAGKHNFKKALLVDQISFSEPTLGDGATIAEIAAQTERRRQHEQDLVDAKSQNEDAADGNTKNISEVLFKKHRDKLQSGRIEYTWEDVEEKRISETSIQNGDNHRNDRNHEIDKM